MASLYSSPAAARIFATCFRRVGADIPKARSNHRVFTGLFAEVYVKEFNKYRPSNAFAFEDVQRTIEEETGTALEDTFQHIDESTAAASIAQVHAVTQPW